MFNFLKANIGTIIVVLILVIIIIMIIRKMIKDKKQGKTSCGCDCANCQMDCHKK